MYKFNLKLKTLPLFVFIFSNAGVVYSETYPKIIALGESSHGVKEFYTSKFKFIDSVSN